MPENIFSCNYQRIVLINTRYTAGILLKIPHRKLNDDEGMQAVYLILISKPVDQCHSIGYERSCLTAMV